MRKLGSVSILVGTLLSTTSYAQSTPDTSAQTAEIIVTAQRRSESLSKTPVAVAVVSGETLAKSQIVSETDLRSATPGLTVKGTAAGNQLNYALRGITIDPYSGSRPGRAAVH